jgi:hypothetical protein
MFEDKLMTYCPDCLDSKAKQMFECSLCDKVYESNYSLKVHIRTHTGKD